MDLSISARFDSQPWAELALCSQTDPEQFFPEKGGSTRAAKTICDGCEVRAECLIWALDNDERFGTWGGLSERERRKLKGESDDTGACGTYPKGYGRHKRRGEAPCVDCRLAANEYAGTRRECGFSVPIDLSEDVAS